MQGAIPTAAEVRDAVARVLTRPEFQEAEPSALATLLSDLRGALAAAFWGLIRMIGLQDVGGSTVAWVLRGFLVLVAALVVVHLVRTLAGVHRGRGRATSPADTGALAAGAAAPDWTAAAERAAAEGRFREAVLALYQALLERLQRGGFLRYDPAKTPGDYRREVRPHPRPARGFDRFLRQFEPVAFGGREPDRGAFDRLNALAKEAASE